MTRIGILERDAQNFSNVIFRTSKAPTLEYYDVEISSRIYPISRGQDKIVFLNKLKELIIIQRDKHRPDCKNPETCIHEQEYGYSLYIIDKLLEETANEYEYEPDDIADKFSADDITNLNRKIDIILEKLEEHDLHHEVIFNEVDDLRYHFNLGKRNWWSLLKGKIVDWAGGGVSGLAIQAVIEEAELVESFAVALQALSK